MNPKKILSSLNFVNEVSSKRQTYYIYEGKNHFISMSVSKAKNGYNFNVIKREAVDYVVVDFEGRKKITTTHLAKESKKPAYIKNSFDALNILYVLCAIGRAKIDTRFGGSKLYFNIKGLKGMSLKEIGRLIDAGADEAARRIKRSGKRLTPEERNIALILDEEFNP